MFWDLIFPWCYLGAAILTSSIALFRVAYLIESEDAYTDHYSDNKVEYIVGASLCGCVWPFMIPYMLGKASHKRKELKKIKAEEHQRWLEKHID